MPASQNPFKSASSPSTIAENLQKAFGSGDPLARTQIVPRATDPEEQRFGQALRIALLDVSYPCNNDRQVPEYDLRIDTLYATPSFRQLWKQWQIDKCLLASRLIKHFLDDMNEYGLIPIDPLDIERFGADFLTNYELNQFRNKA